MKIINLIFVASSIYNVSYSQQLHWEHIMVPSNKDAITILATNSQGLLFAATDYSLFRSYDRGKHWKNIEPIHMFDQPWNSPLEYIVAVDTNKLISSNCHGIYYSTNNGSSWTASSEIPIKEQILAIAADSLGKIFLSTEIGSYVSISSGCSWKFLPPYHASPYSTNSTIYRCMISTSGYILAQEWNDEYRGTFQFVVRNLNKDTLETFIVEETKELDVVCSSGSNLFYTSTVCDTLYYSNNNGKTWNASISLIGGQSLRIIVESKIHKLFAARGNTIFFSSDQGHSWVRYADPINSDEIKTMIIHQDGYLYVGARSGLFRSEVKVENIH